MKLRRRKPKTLVGKALAAWPWMLFGLRLFRLVRRTRRLVWVAAVTTVSGAVLGILRRARRRKAADLPAYHPPAATTPPGYGGGTRETGFEAGPGTETERRLEAEKDGTSAAAPDEPPPVEQEPPTKT